jgi:hypothetical protein
MSRDGARARGRELCDSPLAQFGPRSDVPQSGSQPFIKALIADSGSSPAVVYRV